MSLSADDNDSNGKYSMENWFVCSGCKSHNSISLKRCMIDKTLCLQLVKCAKCGHEWKETWLTYGIVFYLPSSLHRLLQEKEEITKEKTSSSGAVRKRKEIFVQQHEK